MKKLLAFIVIMALAFMVSGATCMKNVQTQACDPPDSVMTVIGSIVELAKFGASTFMPGTQDYVAAVDAQAVATAIAGGICVSTTQLNSLIDWFGSMSVQVLQAQVKAKATPGTQFATVGTVNVRPLIDWRNELLSEK